MEEQGDDNLLRCQAFPVGVRYELAEVGGVDDKYDSSGITKDRALYALPTTLPSKDGALWRC